MNTHCAALAAAIFVLTFVPRLPAQSILPDANSAVTPPAPVNLDVPPEVTPDPQELQEEALAVQAVEQPREFHDWVLQVRPDRGPAEQAAALAILYPDVFARAHPKSPAQVQAEAIAAHAILNPHFPLSGSN